MAIAEKIYAGLLDRGIEVLLDDRDERPGIKFKDTDLIGIPLRVTVGTKAVKEQCVDIKLRRGGEVELAAIDDAVNIVESRLKTIGL
jgi:prolyl-tRNA synthetase